VPQRCSRRNASPKKSPHREGSFPFAHQTDHGAVVCLVVTAAFVGIGASEISRELRWPVRYDHSHCD
jgi:hypothetical protein